MAATKWTSQVDGLEYESDPSLASGGSVNVVPLKRRVSMSLPLVSKSANYTLTSSDERVLCNGTFTITLPTAVGNTREYVVRNIGSGTITMASTSSQTINGGAASSITVAAGVTTRFQSDGANWWTL